jgi:hypothetical protein
MPPAPRHSRPKTSRKPAVKIGVPVLAAATLAGVAAAFVFLTGGSAGSAATTSASHSKISVASSASSLTSDDMMIDVHHEVAARTVRDTARTIRRHYLARLAAARLARKQAAEEAAKQARQAARQQAAAAAAQPTASPSPPASSTGSSGDAAHSALGVCIRNAEEGGSYAWGPGNGGGAYQFVLGTWENYGGSASEYGVAGPAYQDQIFDNAIAAGGASNWTAYDGC